MDCGKIAKALDLVALRQQKEAHKRFTDYINNHGIDTCFMNDTGRYETGIWILPQKHKLSWWNRLLGNPEETWGIENRVGVVEEYASAEEAELGHQKWIGIVVNGPPNQIYEDVCKNEWMSELFGLNLEEEE
jgi:hypothetical protein